MLFVRNIKKKRLNNDLEHRIEQYLRYPTELSEEERFKIELLLKTDGEAIEIAKWLHDFYDEFDQLNKPKLITLSPQKYNPKVSGPMVLAAMSTEAIHKGLTTKATFASEEHKTLLRVLENKQNQDFQFHVLSNYVGSEDRVLIEIEQLGLEFITDKGGVLKGIKSKELSDINWDQALAMIRVPFSSCTFSIDDKRLKVFEECTISVDSENCSVQINNEKISRILLEQDGKTLLYYVETDTISFKIQDNKSFSIHLYS